MDSQSKHFSLLALSLLDFVGLSYATDEAASPIGSPEAQPGGLGFKQDVKYVKIINDLGEGLTMKVHCKSKDDDLGIQIVPPRGTWQFHFRPNFWGTTQFFCHFEWSGESHWFDIYIDKRDNSQFSHYPPCEECVWSIRKKGPSRLNPISKQFDDFQWNKP